ncbi:hypothetical protein rosag_13300 [Roseisolibacter agri]|uniref:Uncharacterized protein n=1 Tax=Roseisolibacter agri TaxID=2014610 RepID=A0AA37Q555_9BACT|nr:hypothetical protein rosag_13300 [Roseisolibacter agri]
MCKASGTPVVTGTVVTVSELVPVGTTLPSITCVPSADAGSCTVSLAGRSATVTIGANLTSEITFANRVASP